MKFVLQRVDQASVSVAGRACASIGKGLLVLMGIHREDDETMCLPWVEKLLKLRLFPDAQSLSTLARLGVNYIVVHTDLYPEGEWPRVEQRLKELGGWLRLEHEEGDGRVYVLRPQ